MRHQVVEQDKVLMDVYRSGGTPALDDAIADASEDPQAVVGMFDRHGATPAGNLVALPGARPSEGYHSGFVRLDGQPAPRRAAMIMHRLAGGRWLISGRLAGEGLAIRETLEGSLFIALALAVLLGLVCGGILGNYVGRRIGGIVAVASRINRHDLSRRVPRSGTGDAFDRLGDQINDMLDRISRLMEELRLLTDSLAHDLRSPVSRLRSAAQSAAQSRDPAEQEELLGSVIRQADALMRILTSVLEISRSEALTSRNQFTSFDVAELTAELAEMYEPLAEEAGARLSYARPAWPMPFWGHRQLLAQAMSNLIENAVSYGEGADIQIAVRRDDKRVCIEISDSGPGIPAEFRGEALRRFGRLDSSRSKEGAGLGLALAASIAHLHGGELVLEDNEPGLRAVLELPIQPAEIAELAVRQEPFSSRQ